MHEEKLRTHRDTWVDEADKWLPCPQSRTGHPRPSCLLDWVHRTSADSRAVTSDSQPAAATGRSSLSPSWGNRESCRRCSFIYSLLSSSPVLLLLLWGETVFSHLFIHLWLLWRWGRQSRINHHFQPTCWAVFYPPAGFAAVRGWRLRLCCPLNGRSPALRSISVTSHVESPHRWAQLWSWDQKRLYLGGEDPGLWPNVDNLQLQMNESEGISWSFLTQY